MGRTRNEIMLDIWETYSRLSPENLSCDGELPRSAINKRRKSLETCLRTLKIELKEDVSEYDSLQWWITEGMKA